MSTPPHTRVGPLVVRPSTGLKADVLLSAQDLATAAGITPAMLARVVRLGLVEPADQAGNAFTAAAAVRLRRMCRLHADLGISLVAAAIVVDLVARLDHLEGELARLRRGA